MIQVSLKKTLACSAAHSNATQNSTHLTFTLLNWQIMADFQVLHAQVDDLEETGYIRVLINGLVKYIFVEPGTFPDSRTIPRSKIAAELPETPPGSWTTIKLTRNARDGKLSFHSAESATLPGIKNLWHPVQIDYFDLVFTRSFTYNVYEAKARDNISAELESSLPL
jgi:hypothetical protein